MATAAPAWALALTAQVRLSDGSTVSIRPIRPGDLALHSDFVHALSPRTGYLRLLSGRTPQDDELRRMTQIDYPAELALVAVATVDGQEVEVGVARYATEHEADAPAGSAAFAIVLSDAWQGRGLATLLLGRLVDAARAAGIRELADITLHDNLGMIALARKLGFTVQRDPADAGLRRLHKSLAPAAPTA